MAGVADYIYQLQQYEEYAFTWKELKKRSGKTDTALRNELSRLISKREIINLRQEFYLIIPPRFRHYGKLPVELYIDKLFNQLEKPYYIAFFSAAGFHCASHQQIQKDYILTSLPNLRDIKKGPIHLRIFATKKWPEKNIHDRKSETGYVKVSSPFLTAVDLINYQTKLGGINRILTVIEELIEEMNLEDLEDLLSWYPYKSTLQRLGLLLELLSAGDNMTEYLYGYLNEKKYFPVLLSPQENKKAGSTDNRWKVDMNVKLESDL